MEKHNRRMSEIIVGRDIAELNKFAAERFARFAVESINDRGRFTVALSGGSTPKAFFHLLASEPFRSQVDWGNVLFFFGDERNVPLNSEESNYRTARENLFDSLNISKDKVFRWKTELGDPVSIADDYEKTIRAHFDTEPPVFDLILLGMGTDGHTASLFPGTLALDETERIAVPNHVPAMNTVRLTLTYPVINAARNVAFLVAGTDKARVLRRVLEGEEDLHVLPSRGIQPDPGSLIWFIDSNAAAYLST
jgi:6-phosphogluconolactonase